MCQMLQIPTFGTSTEEGKKKKEIRMLEKGNISFPDIERISRKKNVRVK